MATSIPLLYEGKESLLLRGISFLLAYVLKENIAVIIIAMLMPLFYIPIRLIIEYYTWFKKWMDKKVDALGGSNVQEK